MSYKKPKQAPPCPTGLPQRKTAYTPQQTKAVIVWLAHLPLIELRKRQLITEQQMKWASEKYSTGNRDEDLLMAIDNLSATEEHLEAAIDIRIFEWNLESPKGELRLIPSEWSEKFMLECMSFQVRTSIIPHNTLPAQL